MPVDEVRSRLVRAFARQTWKLRCDLLSTMGRIDAATISTDFHNDTSCGGSRRTVARSTAQLTNV